MSGKKLSRQRRWQIRHAQLGLCTVCSDQALAYGRCLKHAIVQREYQRAHLGSVKRNRSLTYRLEQSIAK